MQGPVLGTKQRDLQGSQCVPDSVGQELLYKLLVPAVPTSRPPAVSWRRVADLRLGVWKRSTFFCQDL